ncbi:MAG TPA: RNA-directed DNA polymerase [Candidatus Avacidaminococcus intestinavium]|uniref:RNA-directed DNA polymerase n=1 Tax=Candidatus Avacidaminococcus intestinavium TaxID=2840684 RepID=A0A9D1MNE8_9FIRM|nr:RNA-directed DNA polymerase [Candidatus Avacidaminococcus intestinavium]
MQDKFRRYDINQCALYKCKSKKKLEKLLNLQIGELKYINVITTYYHFEIAKSSSHEKRAVSAPSSKLKSIQSRILSLIQYINRPGWLISGEKGKSYINNSQCHISANYLLAMDIKNFYNNCKRNPVYLFFLNELKTSPDVANVLTNIVTYENLIPTGAPTSQLIAFHAYTNMFTEINQMALNFGCIFTLYVDDMTFSSSVPFNHMSLSCNIDKILRKHGHRPKYKKLKYYSKNESKPITGAILTPTHTIKVPNKLRYKIHNTFQKIKNNSNFSDEAKSELLTLKGRLQAAKSIEKNIFPEISRIINS